jgi:hypothetical protein
LSGRELPPTSAFAGDDGSADSRLAAVLAGYGAGPGDRSTADVVAALASARLLVPVLAELDLAAGVEPGGHEFEDHRLTANQQASAGIVALRAPDGRLALPVFSSVETMAAWRPHARPMPTLARRAATAALGEGWEILILDPAGPVPVLVPRPAVVALAHAERWRPAIYGGAVDAEVRSAVTAALSQVPEVARADAEPGRRAEVAVTLALRPGLDRAGLDGVLARVSAALAASETVAARVDSLELRLTTAR